MESILRNLVTISSIGLIFGSVWFALVLGVSFKVDQKSAKARNPNFVIKGIKQAKVSAIIMAFPIVYLLVTGATDTFVAITMFIGFSVVVSTLWRSANSLGSYSFASRAEWRKVRFKTCFQALCLTGFLIFLERGKTYLEQAGYI